MLKVVSVILQAGIGWVGVMEGEFGVNDEIG
jgi:hypothetical protein